MAESFPAVWRDQVQRWAATKERIHELHLFGSRARGDNEPGSDVDLAILLLADHRGEALAYAMFEADGWQAELQELLPVEVQLQFADPEADEIVWPAVQEHGELIYRKTGYVPYGET